MAGSPRTSSLGRLLCIHIVVDGSRIRSARNRQPEFGIPDNHTVVVVQYLSSWRKRWIWYLQETVECGDVHVDQLPRRWSFTIGDRSGAHVHAGLIKPMQSMTSPAWGRSFD